MRIIGGSARGRRLQAPKGQGTRPTSDRVRQSLFDILGQRCDGLSVLDLFAGTGALGLEALSRGASRAVFVEKDRAALAALEKNLESLGFGERAQVVTGDALGAGLARARGPFDLVFADPPYALGAGGILGRLVAAGAPTLSKDARLVLEHDRREDLPEVLGAFVREDTRQFGDTQVTFYRTQATERPRP